MNTPHRPRPVFLDLTKIQMPVGALTSIGHRISGAVMTLGVPVVVYLLALSVKDQSSFDRVVNLLQTLPVKAALVMLVWALSHHLLAGIRHLLSDFNIGAPLRVARRSAWAVNLGALALALLAAVVLA